MGFHMCFEWFCEMGRFVTMGVGFDAWHCEDLLTSLVLADFAKAGRSPEVVHDHCIEVLVCQRILCLWRRHLLGNRREDCLSATVVDLLDDAGLDWIVLTKDIVLIWKSGGHDGTKTTT